MRESASACLCLSSPLQSLGEAMEWAPLTQRQMLPAPCALPAGISADDLYAQLQAAWADADEDEQHEFHEAQQAELAAALAAADAAAAEGSAQAAPAGRAKAASKVRRRLHQAHPSTQPASCPATPQPWPRTRRMHCRPCGRFVCVTCMRCASCCCCRERGGPRRALPSTTRWRWAEG